MDNAYSTTEGQVLLKETQKLPTRIWSIVKCRFCSTKYDMRLVAWKDNSPQCPNCGRTA